jgi:ElaB/YqjD/DUF883 family membrane-anchored ribosome-binding protein
MSEMTSTQRDKLANDLKLVIADTEELLRMTADQAGDSASELRGRIQNRLRETKADLVHVQEITLAKAKAAGRAADEYVHKNPWQSVGMVASAALVIGLLMGRRG